jgi:hypothetical protein
MSRHLAIGLATVLIVAGVAFASYRAGVVPGTSVAAHGSSFEQSRIDELRGDLGTAQAIGKDMTAASPAAKETLRQQGHDVTAQACTISGEIHQLPPDLADFVHLNCADGEVVPGSEFARSTDGGTPSNDPDPGAN